MPEDNEPETTDLQGGPSPTSNAVDVEPREHEAIVWSPDLCITWRKKFFKTRHVFTEMALFYMAELGPCGVPQVVVCPTLEVWGHVKEAIASIPDEFPNDVSAAMVPPPAFPKWVERYEAYYVHDDAGFKYLDHYIAKYAAAVEEGQL